MSVKGGSTVFMSVTKLITSLNVTDAYAHVHTYIHAL